MLRDLLRFVFRLHASNNAARLGADLTGKEVAQMPDSIDPISVRAQYERVTMTGVPVARRTESTFADGLRWEYEVLALPLSSDGEVIDMLMAGMAWAQRS